MTTAATKRQAAKAVNWIVNGKAYETAREPGLCPKCGALDTVTELPQPLRDAQTDGTTHVCHPSLGGCNHGFARTVTPLKYSSAAREIAAYEADIYKAKRDARVAKKARKQRGATKAQLAYRAKLFAPASPSIHDDIAALKGE